MEPNMLQEMRSDMCDKPEQALASILSDAINISKLDSEHWRLMTLTQKVASKHLRHILDI